MKLTVSQLKGELKKIANSQQAKNLQRFFKTGKGEYGEGDIFIGVVVPELRRIARKYFTLDLKDVIQLIKSKIHEERMVAVFILVDKYEKTNHKKIVFHFYITNIQNINNWDLVDLSAPKIVGRHLYDFDKDSASQSRIPDDAHQFYFMKKLVSASLSKSQRQSKAKLTFNSSENELPRAINILSILAKSDNLWERRIGIMATFWFIKNNQFKESLELSRILLQDKHDLIHKAVGWMLREMGKRDLKTEIEFLDKYYKKMPRIMLRYAIEKFPEKLRMTYLKKEN